MLLSKYKNAAAVLTTCTEHHNKNSYRDVGFTSAP